MRRFFPLTIATGLLLAGFATILMKQLVSEEPAAWQAYKNDDEARESIKFENDRSEELDDRLMSVSRRLNSRLDTVKFLLNGELDIPNAFEIYHELNVESHDPLHPIEGFANEFDRLSWIAKQLSFNMDQTFDGDEYTVRRFEIRNQIDWMLAEVVR